MTPKGTAANLRILDIRIGKSSASCAVRKDGGDDPDATHGMLIYAKAERIEKGVAIEGGIGIGRATKPGLSIGIGEAAINPVPKAMISQQAELALAEHGENGVKITIYAPEGEEVAKRTFNSALGIIGGISILGTSGVVEPMSEDALIATINAEASVRLAEGRSVLVGCPGNYGTAFAAMELGITSADTVKYSNYLGEMIEIAESLGASGLLIASHLGKLVKVAGGMLNTHSKYGDCRMPLIAAHAAAVGISASAAREILASATVDSALGCLDALGIKNEVMGSLLSEIERQLARKAQGRLKVGAIAFTYEHGRLGGTSMAGELLEQAINESRRLAV
jgi:cobalt-precorrin-5B (C1)-methyltransferase